MNLHNFDTATFLRDYWQQKPLLIRNPWKEWTNPLDPDELAGLACEPEVESRIVLARGGRVPWELRNGPVLLAGHTVAIAVHLNTRTAG